MDRQHVPLAVALLNAATIGAAAAAGGLLLLVQGNLLLVGGGALAALVYAVVLVALFWLRLAIIVPFLFALDAGHHRLGRVLHALASFYAHAAILGWTACVLWRVEAAGLGWGTLLWGFAIAHAPVYFHALYRLHFPLVVYLLFLSQAGYLAAGVLLGAGLANLATLGWIALAAAAASSVFEPTRGWLAASIPD